MKKNLITQVCTIGLFLFCSFGLISQNIYDFNSIADAGQNGELKMPSTHNFQYLVSEGEFGTLDLYDFTAFVPINNSSSNGYLSINHEISNGGVSIFDINQNVNKEWTVSNIKQVQYGNVNRPCSGHVTSWGTVLSCEESSLGEVLETDPVTGASTFLHQLGRLAHENVVENKSNNRTFYTGEDTGNGVVLKFVADNPSDLSSGDLYALDLDPGGTSGTWDLIPNASNTDTHAEAISVGASTFSGVEDIEISPIDGKVYFAVKGTGTIYRFDEDTPLGGGTVSNFEEYVTNQSYDTGNGNAQFGTGIDNLAFDDVGNLWALQDGGDDQIWVIEEGHTMANPMVKLFGQAPNGAEPTGITFTPDFKYLFLSVMHPNGNNSANQQDVFNNTVPNNLDYAVVISRNENWSTDVPVTTLNLNNFDSNCGIENITGAVETSGITHSETTNTLFAVSDNLSIYELDLDGNVIRTISLTGFEDTEGITWLGGNQFGITEERKREIAVVTINSGTTNINYPGAGGVIDITDSGDGSNNGFEGLAYDAVNDILYIAKEGDQDNNNTGIEPKIYKITDPISEVGNTISNPIEPFTNYPSCNNFDASGLEVSPTGSLLLISEQCNIIYELNPNNGNILSQMNVPLFAFPEGLTMIDDNQLWVTGENNQLQHFVITGSSCDDGDPNTNNDQFDSSCNCMGIPGVCPTAGQPCDDNDPCTNNDVFGTDITCPCAGTYSGDSDNDGVCDNLDVCPNFNDNLIGTTCDDGNPNTINDEYTTNCICEGTTSVATLDLNNFDSNCGIENITGAVETSGITHSVTTNTLFVVSDNLTIYELDLDGNVIRTISLTGFEDTEGITWLGGNQFGITEERKREIAVVTINPGMTNVNYPGAGGVIDITDSGDGSNNGFEGLAYDAVNDILYVAKEGDQDNNNTGIEPKIYKISDPISEVGNTISNPIEPFTNYPSCNNFDASGLEVSPTGSLLLLSEQCNIIYELDPNNGNILSQMNVPLFTVPEGLTMIDDNQLWVTGENNQLQHFVITGSSCDDGDPNTNNDEFDSSCNCMGIPGVCPTAGQPCDDNDPCTNNDVFGTDITCPCAGTYSGDSDNDGVCDNLDICPNFNDNLIGTSCDDGNPNTENDEYTTNCICEGTPVTTCPTAGQPCDDNDPCTNNDVFGTDITCPCAGTYSGDSDNDGVCDNLDVCPNFNDNLIGTSCDDGNPNTENDEFTTNCICEGTPVTACVDQNAESFETGFGTWIQGTGDDLDWTRDSGGTPSSSTGPTTGSDGSWYLYIEASGNGSGYPNKTAILESPCYDVPDNYGLLQFDYHMYGTAANMILEFQISNDDGNTWTTVWSQQGDQGNQWNTATINLFPYAESTVKLRFFGTTGETWQGDIAIDNIDVFPGGCPDIGLPCDDNDPCTINDVFDNLCNCVGTFQDDDNDGICNANDICPQLNNALFGTPCDDGNPNTTNDQYSSVTCSCEGNSVGCTTVIPEQESFETNFGAWTQNSTDDLDWTRDSGGTPSSSTGPSNASDGTWYAYIEASGNGSGYPNMTAGLISPCYDIPSDGAVMNFAYHMYGSAANMILELQVSTDEGLSWTTVWSDQGNQGNQWNNASIDLSAYSNSVIQIQFFGTTGETWQGDIAIDILDLILGGGCPTAGQACDDGDPCTDNDVIGIDISCPCAGTYSGDTDGDGVCNNLDVCPNFDDNLIGSTCDDGNPNTINDVYTNNCLCEGTTTNTTLDLSSFDSNCTIELLSGGVETSGMTYSSSTNTLFVVSDDLSAYEVDLNGNIIRTITLAGFEDTEGIVWLGGNQFGITEERKREIAVVTINSGTTTINYPGAAGVIDLVDSGDGDNNGFEGLAYDAASDILYVGKEGDQDNNNTGIEPKIYKVSNPLSEVGNTITNPIEAFTNYPSCTNFDVAGLAMSPTGTLIIVSHQCNILYEVDPNDGTILSFKSIAEFSIPEGVTLVSENEMWVTGEFNDIKQYVVVGSSCDDGDPNTANDVWDAACNCQGTAGPTCINILPESESFEIDFGAWTQSTLDNLDWTRDANGTPSSNTGPSNASDGVWYAYIEASGNGTGYPNKTAGLISPCFDIFTTGGAQIDFDYHMFGTASNMILEFQVSTDDGASWTSLWTQQGNQGNQWNAQTVDLSQYVNTPVLFQFFGTTGETWQGDIAIDNIYIDLNSGNCPTAGQSCDDGDPCTINDTYDNAPECNCFGTYSGDNDGDGVCAAEDPNDNDPCIPISCAGCTLIDLEDFESNFGIWNDGGSDCARSTAGNPSSGIYSVRLRDNSGVGSSMYTNNIDLSNFNEAEIHFHYYANSMETNEDFFLEYSTNGGGSWTIYKSYVSGSDFVNNQDYNVTELITGVAWTSNTQFRIRCDASSNGDQVYIDEVEISGCSPITGMQDSSDEDSLLGSSNRSSKEIDIYPNPAIDVIFVDMGSSSFGAKILVHGMDGKLVRSIDYNPNQSEQIEITTNGMTNGLYQITVLLEDGSLIHKKVFVVK